MKRYNIFFLLLFTSIQFAIAIPLAGEKCWDYNYNNYPNYNYNSFFGYSTNQLVFDPVNNGDSIIDCKSSSMFLLEAAEQFYNLNEFDSALLCVSNLDSVVLSCHEISKEYKCRYYYLKGLIKYKLQSLESAIYYFNYSYNISSDIGNDSVSILSLKFIGNVYYLQGKYHNSISYYNQSLKILENGDVKSERMLSSILQNIGIIYSMFNNIDSAFYYMSKSIRLKEQYLDENDPVLASGYLNLSRLVQLMGELNSALFYINRAEEKYLQSNLEDDQVLASIYYNKGSILITMNDFEESLYYHELALEMYKGMYDVEDKIFLELFHNFGLIYSNIGQLDQARKYFELSLKGFVSEEQFVKGNLLLGIIYLNSNDFISSREYLNSAVFTAENTLGPLNSQTANAYLNYGVFCEQTNNLDSALIYYQKAADIYEAIYGEKSRDVSNTYTLIGNYYSNKGLYSTALEYFQKAIITFIPEFNEMDIIVNPEDRLLELDLNLFYSLSGKANSLYLSYLESSENISYLELCLETSILAIHLFEKIKSTLYGENTKLIVTGRVNQVYDLATSAGAILYSKNQDYNHFKTSFKYSEKSKAAVLLSTVKEDNAILLGNIPEEIRVTEKELKRDITQFQNIIFEENQKSILDSAKIIRMRNNLFETKLAYDSLVTSLEKNFPEYYNLKYNSETVSIQSIQENIENDQALIEYKLTDSTLFTFIIKSDTSILITIPIDPEFREKIDQYVTLTSQFPKADSLSFRCNSFARLGKYISDILQLNHHVLDETSSLIIIPDDILGYLSFEALVSKLPKDTQAKYDRLDYLIHRYCFSYGYSATLFYNDYKKSKKGRNVLAIAPDYESLINNENLVDADPVLRDIKNNLSSLKHTQDEVESVTEIFGGRKVVGNEATENVFKKESSKYKILHFAMHTLINDDEPLSSRLVFSLSNDTIEDGFLNTYEIYNLDLNAELAVLSACRTGIGAIRKGEGIMSLARGFLYAGVPGIIMTLWAVEDRSSAVIITGFYENLKKGQDKAKALRNAKLNYLNNTEPSMAHPYFWAAYVQIGDDSPVYMPKVSYIYLASAVIFFISLIFFIRYYRNRKQIK